MMNIVHLHMVYPRYKTGVDRYLEMYARGIQKGSYGFLKSHTVFLTDDTTRLFSTVSADDDGVVTATIPFIKSKLLFKDAFWRKKYFKVIIETLAPYLEKMPPLIFQYHNLFLSELAEEMKDHFGGKTVTHLHCIPWKYSSTVHPDHFNRLYQLYLDEAYDLFGETETSTVRYDLSDRIICLSEAAKDYLVKIHQVDRDRISIIYNGLEKRDVIRNSRDEPVPEILYAGKISKEKGVFEMLDALVHVKEKGYRFVVRMAGSVTQSDFTRLKTYSGELDIHFLGQITLDELYHLYARCTMGIIPSLYEQCSYVALEMAMNGVPMIVSEIDALAEIFEHEKTALLTPLGFDRDFGLKLDEGIFVKNIVRLLEERELREQLSGQVRDLYEERFTLDKMMAETVEMYQKMN
ncbi:MAG: glycosyltransferase family 4 protein [Bacteroidales bacterium]|jgi:glycosyltransferase involved in cell wall biosynthesis|nr:glycosyltransferase family 4 protein [Bacteroidales bacterium]